VDALVSAWTRDLTKEQLAERFRAAGVPSAPVRELGEVVHDPHLRQRGMLQEIDHPDMGPLVVPHSPIRVGDFYAEIVPSPRLGQHNDEIYGEWLGLDEDTLAGLKKDGVI
jgi:crotonobetainyl-CoA:carnitine CoA-transferase CaiB-like acyl-CoA transferase